MSNVKSVKKNVLDENGNLVKDQFGNYIMEIVEIPLSSDELLSAENEKLKLEFLACISYLENTRWVIDKKWDLGLTDEEIYAKHSDIIDNRITMRNRIQELQLLGIEVW